MSTYAQIMLTTDKHAQSLGEILQLQLIIDYPSNTVLQSCKVCNKQHNGLDHGSQWTPARVCYSLT